MYALSATGRRRQAKSSESGVYMSISGFFAIWTGLSPLRGEDCHPLNLEFFQSPLRGAGGGGGIFLSLSLYGPKAHSDTAPEANEGDSQGACREAGD